VLSGRKWLRKAANQGFARAQFFLGLLYEEGQGVPRDMAQAVLWYGRAAEQGDLDAQNNLATAYLHGLGTAPDPAKAAAWYRRAAESGHATAQVNLGVVLTRLGRRDEAVAALSAALRLNPSNAQARHVLELLRKER